MAIVLADKCSIRRWHGRSRSTLLRNGMSSVRSFRTLRVNVRSAAVTGDGRTSEVKAADLMLSAARMAIGLLGFALVLAVPAIGGAEPLRGDLGPRSQATVAISVSVAPRVRSASLMLAQDPSGSPEGEEGRTLVSLANAPGLRYRLLVYPAGGVGAPAENGRLPREPGRADAPMTGESNVRDSVTRDSSVLVLIVPD